MSEFDELLELYEQIMAAASCEKPVARWKDESTKEMVIVTIGDREHRLPTKKGNPRLYLSTNEAHAFLLLFLEQKFLELSAAASNEATSDQQGEIDRMIREIERKITRLQRGILARGFPYIERNEFFGVDPNQPRSRGTSGRHAIQLAEVPADLREQASFEESTTTPPTETGQPVRLTFRQEEHDTRRGVMQWKAHKKNGSLDVTYIVHHEYERWVEPDQEFECVLQSVLYDNPGRGKDEQIHRKIILVSLRV